MTLKAIESVAETPDHGDQVTDARRQRAIDLAQAGAPLNATEFAAILRVGISQFYKLAKTGAYDDFRLKPAIGPKAYSGVLVARWLRGEVIHDVRAFGRKRQAR